MPLKHKTETRLVVLNGALLLVSGFVASLLPDFPLGALPWAICFVLSIVYPVLLHPLLKKNRADNEFRLLHWGPAIVFAIWFILQLASSVTIVATIVLTALTWAWTLPLVTIGFFLLVLFCLHVIRRRTSRILFLALLFVPYAAVALLGEQDGFEFNDHITATLWNQDFWEGFIPEFDSKAEVAMEKDTEEVAVVIGQETNLQPSEDPKEEAWRASLRAFQQRMENLMAREQSQTSSEMMGTEEDPLPEDLRPGGSGAHIRAVATKPNNLPESGFGWNAFILIMTSLYCGLLHDRMRKRV